jgi:hypothetical protein
MKLRPPSVKSITSSSPFLRPAFGPLPSIGQRNTLLMRLSGSSET